MQSQLDALAQHTYHHSGGQQVATRHVLPITAPMYVRAPFKSPSFSRLSRAIPRAMVATSVFFSNSFLLVLTASCGNRTGNLAFPAGRTGRTLTGYQLGYFAFGYQRQQRDDSANLRSYALTLPLATSAMALAAAVAFLAAL